jgi:S-adenosylmethionine-diacylglycerol 3-amino-3-carboxypropyl transferase
VTTAAPDWVSQAATLPVAFAQVREDPLLDLRVVERIPRNARVLLIASGGCTAALLAAASNVAFLHLVDPNPAQMALTRLKLRLLRHADSMQRLAVLGHAPMDPGERRSLLRNWLEELSLPENSLGALERVARDGPDYTGRYECVFAALRECLRDQITELEQLLKLKNLAEQRQRIASGTVLGQRLDEALDAVMALPNLVRLFGSDATNNPVEPFSRHFARRIRHALATLPAGSNPYLWQMILGRYPATARTPWLDSKRVESLPRVQWSIAYVDTVLENAAGEYDFVHLSNVLDWLAPERASHTLRLAHSALRAGGWMLLRQLNSTLDIPALGAMFEWHPEEAAALHDSDRSFFYRKLHLGRNA